MATIATTTHEYLIAAAGDPAELAKLAPTARTPLILTNMAEHTDQATHDAAMSLIGKMTILGLHEPSKSAKKVAAQVERIAEAVEAFRVFPAEESAEAWVRSLDPIGLPLDLFPDPDPEPTTPASVPVPLDFSAYDAWEAEEVGWREFAAHRESILTWVDMRLVEMSEWEDDDEAAEWAGRAA